MPLQVGDHFPSTCLTLKGHDLDLCSRFKTNPGLLIGCLGAFHPLCSSSFLPGYKLLAPFLRERGLDFLGCLAVNDPFVLRAWAKKLKISTEIMFVSDYNASLTKALAMQAPETDEGFGSILPRSRRFALLVGSNAKILAVSVDQEAFADAFVAKISQALKICFPRSLLQAIQKIRCNIILKESKFLGVMSSVDDLFPFSLAPSSATPEPDEVHVTFDYNGCALVDDYMIRVVSPYIEIRSAASSEDLGRALVKKSGEDEEEEEYLVESILISPHRCVNMMTSECSKPSCSLLISHRSTTGNKRMMTVFHLQPNGRDVLLANFLSIPPNTLKASTSNHPLVLKRTDLPDKEHGFDISHFVWPFASFYKFHAPIFPPLPNEDSSTQYLWFVASNAAFASERQLEMLREVVDKGDMRIDSEIVGDGSRGPSDEIRLVASQTQ